MATVNLQLQPFPVPESVTVVRPARAKRQDSIQPAPVILLRDLSDEALEALITEFAENVMKAARPD